VKVYGLSRGDYSDYRVCAIFKNRADAEAVGPGFNEVEEYDLMESPPEKRVVYYAHAQAPGWEVSEQKRVEWPWDTDFLPDNGRPFVHEWHPVGIFPYRISVRGLDAESVRKALFDRAAQIRAEQEGIA
jgi:hypothetical protein